KERLDFSQTNGSQTYHFNVNNTPVNLNELGGSADIRTLWIHYYREALGAIFIIDSSNFDSFPIVRSLLSQVYHNKYMSGKPILIVANKQDCNDFVDIIDISRVFSIEKLANKTRSPTLICASGLNQRDELLDGVEWMIKLILDNIKIIHNRIKFFDTVTSSRFSERTIDRPRTSRERRILKENMQLERPQSAPSQIRIGNTYLVNVLPTTPMMKNRPEELNVENLETDGNFDVR
ncbi:ADP-ribosylation factor-like protein 13B, partial [Pseudolycoriella hygida]